jgi:hypothetical protein
MAKITIKHIISLFIILLSLTFVQAEKSKFISISSVNEGKPAAPGQSVPFKFKVTHTPSSDDKSFDVVFKSDDDKVKETLTKISSENYQFNKDNEYNAGNIVIPAVAEGSYKIYAYIGSDKVSESYSVSVKGAPVTSTTTATSTATATKTTSEAAKATDASKTTDEQKPAEPTKPGNSTEPAAVAGASSQANVSSPGNYENPSSPFNWKSVLIIGSIILVILIIFGILFYCCIKDSKRKRDDSIYKLPPAVSEPHLVASSSQIKAYPLYNNNNINTINEISSPLGHSNSNYSDMYNNQETQGLTQTTRSQNITQPANAYSRDTIYSNNSAYMSHDSQTGAEEDMSSPSPSYYFKLFKPQQVYRVLYDFEPSLQDEMEIQAGDIIRTEETFEDGWAYGINMSTGKKGTFPMNCLEDDFATDGDSRSAVSERSQSRSRRTSSLPNNQNAQAIQMMLNSNNNGTSQNFQKSYYMTQVNNTRF